MKRKQDLEKLRRTLALEQEPDIWDLQVCQTCHADMCRSGKCVTCLKREIAELEPK